MLEVPMRSDVNWASTELPIVFMYVNCRVLLGVKLSTSLNENKNTKQLTVLSSLLEFSTGVTMNPVGPISARKNSLLTGICRFSLS